MTNKEGKAIIFLIIAAVVIFLVGAGLGILYKAQKDAPELKKAGAVATLSSGLVSSIGLYGQVSKVEGEKIALTYSGQTITVPVASNTQVITFKKTSSNPNPVQQTGTLADVKAGNNVNVNLKLSPDGSMTAQAIIVFPFGPSAAK